MAREKGRILVLCGYPGSGKDEIAKYLVEKHGFHRIAFADPVRETALAINPVIPLSPLEVLDLGMDGETFSEPIRLKYLVERFGWDVTKRCSKEVRELLQRIGTEGGRDIHGGDCWVNIAKNKMSDVEGTVEWINNTVDFVFTDCRFESEVDMLADEKYHYDIVFAQVTRPGVGKINNHKSEQMDYEEMSDITIENNGTLEDLHALVEGVIQNEF